MNTWFFSLSSAAAVFTISLATASPAQESERPQVEEARDQKMQHARDLIAQAAQHEEQTSWERAIECYQKVLSIFPDYHPAQMALGRCYEGLRDTSSAIDTYRSVANSETAPPDVVQTARERVEGLLTPQLAPEQQEAYEIGQGLLDRTKQLKEESNLDPRRLGTYLKTRETAIAQLAELRRTAEGYLPLLLELGQAYELAGRRKEAIQVYGEYLQRYTRLGLPLGADQRTIRTHKALLEAEGTDDEPSSLRLTVQQATRLYDMGSRAEECGDYAQAANLYETIVCEYPNNYQARYRLGLCLYARGENAKAIEQWRYAAQGENAPISLIEELCGLIEKAACPKLSPEQERRLAEAIAHYEAAYELFSRGYLVAYSDWGTFERRRAEDSPEKAYETELTRRRARTYSVYHVVWNNESRARSLLDALIKEVPDYVPFHVYLGKAWQLDLELTHGANFNDTSRTKAYDAYDKYLRWYDNLNIPQGDKYRDIATRHSEMWPTWRQTTHP